MKQTFSDKTKFKKYLSTNQALQKALEGKFQYKEVNHHPRKQNK